MNIVLQGVLRHECKDCGEGYVSLRNTDALDRFLVEHVILQPRRLHGGEIRFLRMMLGWTGQEFAEYFQTPKTTVSKWENNTQQPSPPVDLLIRLLAANDVGIEFSVERAPSVREKSNLKLKTELHAIMYKDGWGLAA